MGRDPLPHLRGELRRARHRATGQPPDQGLTPATKQSKEARSRKRNGGQKDGEGNRGTGHVYSTTAETQILEYSALEYCTEYSIPGVQKDTSSPAMSPLAPVQVYANDFFNPAALQPKFQLSTLPTYYIPEDGNLMIYRQSASCSDRGAIPCGRRQGTRNTTANSLNTI